MVKLKFVCFVFLVMSSFVHSQQQVARPPHLQIIFPTTGDTVSYSKIRIAGNTNPAATLAVNGSQVKVYRSGAFVDRVDLKTGENIIVIVAKDSSGETQQSIRIFRQPPIPVSPRIPTEIDARIIWPETDITLVSGDMLEVRFKGSPGGNAKFSIDKLCKNIPMTELTSGDASGMSGIYSGVTKLSTDKKIASKSVHFELTGKDGRKAKQLSPGLVTVLPDQIPLIGETISQTYLKTSPYGWGIMSILPEGIRLQIRGERGGHYKVCLAGDSFAYVNSSDVKLLPAGTSVPKTSISLPAYSINGDWIQLRMNVQTNCPYSIVQNVDPATIELTVYGAHLMSQWITYPEYDETIKMIRWHQPSADVFKLFVTLNMAQQWGYRVRYLSGQIILEIRRKPKIALPPSSPVQGLIFTLDAGHGGREKGAVGATGLMEKDVNLNYTKKLAALLDSAGAQIVITRQVDSTMTLAERVELARKANTHIFCWLHNNSIGATSDAVAVRGTSTYFTVPQNQALAWTVYPFLLDLGLIPFGRVQSDYYVTRQTDMLIVLVEGAFMSNPEDEMLLADDKFLDRLARAVFNGLEEFCRKQLDQ
ncbi:MAG: N-acetylmuramoyl-L-alanine amidase [bacterium]|nr:N-acetylmuramoyl-L-alanine amidase [bacterium]